MKKVLKRAGIGFAATQLVLATLQLSIDLGLLVVDPSLGFAIGVAQQIVKMLRLFTSMISMYLEKS